MDGSLTILIGVWPVDEEKSPVKLKFPEEIATLQSKVSNLLKVHPTIWVY